VTIQPATWRSGLRAVGICAALIAISAVTAAVWFVVQHHDAQSTSAAAASVEFEQLRARFTGVQPLLDMRVRTAQHDATTRPVQGALRTFHTVVFDTRGSGRLVKMTVPYWFGRRYARHDGTFAWLGELTFLDDTEFDPERIRLSLADIERRGPGLLVDYRHPGGGQFMAWVE
jgi:hypothetical protein